MSERYSWIEKDGVVLFLTGNDVYNTPRGKKLQKHTSLDDFYGHGAIRFYYDDMKEGLDREYTDFTSPDNFPPELVKAIKSGAMAAFGTTQAMIRGLLSNAGRASLEAVLAGTNDMDIVIQGAMAAENIAYDAGAQAYRGVCKMLREVDMGYLEVDKAYRTMKAAYWEVLSVAFWHIFSDVNNRAKAWK